MNKRQAVTLVLTGLALVVFVRATCGPRKPSQVELVERIDFADFVFFHNVGITFDGTNYYTLNGGNDDYCQINKYTNDGELVESYDVDLDGRTIWYRPDLMRLYVKDFSTTLYDVNLEDEDADEELEEIFQSEQSSIGFALKGQRMFEQVDSMVYVYDEMGELRKAFRLERYCDDALYSTSIAASDKYLFVWQDETAVDILTHNGGYVATVRLPVKGFPLSLSWCNGMLWVAEDADGSTDRAEGRWHGYQIVGLN